MGERDLTEPIAAAIQADDGHAAAPPLGCYRRNAAAVLAALAAAGLVVVRRDDLRAAVRDYEWRTLTSNGGPRPSLLSDEEAARLARLRAAADGEAGG